MTWIGGLNEGEESDPVKEAEESEPVKEAEESDPLKVLEQQQSVGTVVVGFCFHDGQITGRGLLL